MKCPHCDQWISLGATSCSKCGEPLDGAKEGADSSISSVESDRETTTEDHQELQPDLIRAQAGSEEASSTKNNWKLATGVIGVSLLAFILFSYLKQDKSDQLGFYGQWDKNKDGYLEGVEIEATITALKIQPIDINVDRRGIDWQPPHDIDLDNKLSRFDFLNGGRSLIRGIQGYDLNKDDYLDEKEIQALKEKTNIEDDLMVFDINKDNLVDLLEIPPTYLTEHREKLFPRRSPRDSARGGGGSRGGGRKRPDEGGPTPDVDKSGQLGFYGQWDKNKDGYLEGVEIREAITALIKLKSQIPSVSGRGDEPPIRFDLLPPDDIDQDNKLSRFDFLNDRRSLIRAVQEYDLNRDGYLDEKEIQALKEKTNLEDDLMAFDINKDNLVDLLEIPPNYVAEHLRKLFEGNPSSGGRGRGGGRKRPDEGGPTPAAGGPRQSPR